MSDWSSYWSDRSLSLRLALGTHHAIVWHVYKKFLDPVMPKNPRIIELGSGKGELTARLLERYGGSATLVDNNDAALHAARENFASKGLDATFVKADLFRFRPEQKYDLVHSEGLIEHFIGDQQIRIVRAHATCAGKNGFVFICVPQSTWYYRIWRKTTEMRGMWYFGYEKPISWPELADIMEKAGIRVSRALNYNRYAFAIGRRR